MFSVCGVHILNSWIIPGYSFLHAISVFVQIALLEQSLREQAEAEAERQETNGLLLSITHPLLCMCNPCEVSQ